MKKTKSRLTRRSALATLGATAGMAGLGATLPAISRMAHAQSPGPIRIGLQLHRTGIGAAYGRWYGQVAEAALARINAMGGINGREVEMIIEDDGTDPKRGAEVVERFATRHKCDVIFGTLFSHVVIGSAPRAGELKIPYFVVSEGHHVASGTLNRYIMQPGITDVKSQVVAMAPYVSENLGRKVTMMYADFAFGQDHLNYFSEAIKARGGEVIKSIGIPPAESSFTRYFPEIPMETEVLYHVLVGPNVLTYVREMGEFFGQNAPEIFGFMDSLEAVDINSPGLEFLEGAYFWEGMCRYKQDGQTKAETAYRKAVGVDDNGASIADARDVSTYAHMFGVWETLNIIKKGMEKADYGNIIHRVRLIEALENTGRFDEGDDHPQGRKIFNGRTHQVFGHQNISRVQEGRLVRVHRTSIEDTFYPDDTDYTKHSF